jgi:hypothetical protein
MNLPPNHPPSQPQTPGKIRPNSRAPWRTYFYDHPNLTIDRIQSNQGGKPKLYCKACFAAHLALLRDQDAQEVQTARRREMRSNEELTACCMSAITIKELTPDVFMIVWNAKKQRDVDTIGWIRGESKTILNHLRNCGRQPESVQQEAAAEYSVWKGKGLQMGPPTIAIPLVQARTSNLLPLDTFQGPQPHGVYLPVPFVNDPASISGSRSSGSSVGGSSRANSPYLDSLPVWQKTSRSSSVASYSMNRDRPIEWSADQQHVFDMRLGRLTASATLAMSWIENPEFLLFCLEFVHPSANVPSRKAMRRRILPALRREFRKKAQAAIKRGSMATIQGDGWSAINEHHLNAFMMTVEQKVTRND